jgi:predicted 2-oxoglutarate/Fe(II)-dependent dioxygenase YbiX
LKPRIFVRIAAYRDSECEWTVRDAFAKAEAPERVFVGVCWQYHPAHDPPSFRVHERPGQVRVTRVLASRTRGPCWARRETEQLWRGEDFTLQIDSHSRFVAQWDRWLIDELAACPAPKALLSASPPPYLPPDTLAIHARPTIRCATAFDAKGDLRFRGAYLEGAPARPRAGAFVAGGFMFSSASLLREVPYDPYLYFEQEEAAYSLRVYTHGWDVFSPARIVVHHLYARDREAAGLRHPTHWSDYPSKWLQRRGLERFDHLTGYRESTDEEVLRELDTYGLGTERSIADFEAYAGIDFRAKRVSERARRGQFGSAPSPSEPAAHAAETAFESPSESVEPRDGSSATEALESGDFVPWFSLRDDSGEVRGIEASGGEWTLLVMGSDLDAGSHLVRRIAAGSTQMRTSPRVLLVSLGSLATLQVEARRRGVAGRVWCDELGDVHRLFAAVTRASTLALLTPNLRVSRIWRVDDLAASVSDVACEVERECASVHTRGGPAHAPVLIVPDALTPAECEELVSEFHRSESFQGMVGAGDGVAVSPSNKSRRDSIVRGESLRFVDERLSRRLFPEVKKVFALDVTHREAYKLGRYDAEHGGFFFRHRDSLDPALAYRRFAVTIGLNDDFDGGELCFPEYPAAGYKLPRGFAVVFPCTLMHELARMKRGARYVLVGFLFGEHEARAREEALLAAGKNPERHAWRVLATRPGEWLQ